MSQAIERLRHEEVEYQPPAPRPNPDRLGTLALIRALRRNPLECWSEQHFQELIVEGGLPIGHALIVHQPQAIRHILVDNAANYRKDSFQRRVLSAGLSDGLLGVEGERWRVQRRILAPAFSAATVRSFLPAMIDAIEAITNRWPDDHIFDVAAEMGRITLGALERTIFSDGLERGADEIRNAMSIYFDTLGRIDLLDLFGVPKIVPRLGRLRVRATLSFFERAIDEIITKRRQSLASQPVDTPRDLLTLLLNAMDPETGVCLSESEVRSNILTFISAGHETTSNALTWAIFLLSQSPQWLARVEAEVQREFNDSSVSIPERLVETRAVIDEALRLYPPIAAISRVAIAPDEIDGTKVRPGTLVVISPYVLHRHRLLWDAPDSFDPGRFLGEARRRIDKFSYLPFGIGPRTCIGSTFALQEATLVLAVLLKRFKFSLREGHTVWPMLRVTLRPAGGMPMRISRKT
jgi:cytochrome P450